jgi:choline monooxygenase
VKLCEGAGSGRTSFTCPFHAWRYDLAGRLTNLTEPEGFDQLAREDHGLIELSAPSGTA